jgi:hypothetical protein
MRLTLGFGVGNQGVVIEALGVPEYRAGDIDRIVKGKFTDDIDGGVVEAGQPLCKLRAGRNFNLVRKPPDYLAEGQYLVIAIPAGNQQIGRMLQRPHAAFGRSAQDRVIEIPQEGFYFTHFCRPQIEKNAHTNDIWGEHTPHTQVFSEAAELKIR